MAPAFCNIIQFAIKNIYIQNYHLYPKYFDMQIIKNKPSKQKEHSDQDLHYMSF